MSEMDLGRLVRSDASRVVSVEYREPGKALLYRRDGDAVICEAVDYEPWLWFAANWQRVDRRQEDRVADGYGGYHNVRVSFPT